MINNMYACFFQVKHFEFRFLTSFGFRLAQSPGSLGDFQKKKCVRATKWDIAQRGVPKGAGSSAPAAGVLVPGARSPAPGSGVLASG